MRNCFDLSNRVAVVTGGTSGIGRAIALGLAEQGADVVPTGRRANHIEEVCTAIEGMGRRTLRHVSDIRSRQSVDAFRDAILHEFGRVDILVNSAGITFRQPTITSATNSCLRFSILISLALCAPASRFTNR